MPNQQETFNLTNTYIWLDDKGKAKSVVADEQFWPKLMLGQGEGTQGRK